MSAETLMTIITSAITGIVSLLSGTFLGNWNAGRREAKKLEGEQTLAEKQQPVDQLAKILEKIDGTYSKMLESSEARRVADVTALVERLDKMDIALANCLQSHVTDAEDRGFLKGRVDELSRQLNLNSLQTIGAKETAVAANAKADAAMDASQTALVNLPPPDHK